MFNPASFLTDKAALTDHGKEGVSIALIMIYGEVEIELACSTVRGGVLAKWKILK